MKFSRGFLENAFHGVAIFGGFVAIVLGILLLVAGTFISGDQIGLRSLAFASFDGIVANNDSSALLVRMYWFPASFAWEYPDAPAGVPKAGISSRSIDWSLDLDTQFRTIAQDIGLPREEWDCKSECSNPFFAVWNTWARVSYRGGSLMYFILMLLAILLTAYQFYQEWAMKKKPYWMRCQCIIGKSLCPFPKGTREEIEARGEHTWDRARFAYWSILVLYFVLPAILSTVITMYLESFLGYTEYRLPSEMYMNIKRGSAHDALGWGAFAAVVVSFFCIVAKWQLTRKEQDFVALRRTEEAPESRSQQPMSTA